MNMLRIIDKVRKRAVFNVHITRVIMYMNSVVSVKLYIILSMYTSPGVMWIKYLYYIIVK